MESKLIICMFKIYIYKEREQSSLVLLNFLNFKSIFVHININS